MKKKILNWVYRICRKILATDIPKSYWLTEMRIPQRLKSEVSFSDQHVPFGMSGKEVMENRVKNEVCHKIFETLVVVNRKAPWDEHITIYSTEILIVDVNGKNENK